MVRSPQLYKPLPEGVHLPILHGQPRHHPAPDPRVLEAMLPLLRSKFGGALGRNHSFGWEAENRSREGTRAGRRPHRSHLQRDHLHLRSHRVRQPGRQGRSRRSAASAAATSSPRPPSTRPSSTPAKSSRSRSYRCNRTLSARKGKTALSISTSSATPSSRYNKTILVNHHVRLQRDRRHPAHHARDPGKLCHEKGVIFHSDAVQAVGKIPRRRPERQHQAFSRSPPTRSTAPRSRRTLRAAAATPASSSPEQINGGGEERGHALQAPSTSPASSASARPAGSRADEFRVESPPRAGLLATSRPSSKLLSTTSTSTAIWSTVSPATST